MKNIFLSFFVLFLSVQSFSQVQIKCADKPYEVRVSGFFFDEKKKETLLQTLVKIVSPYKSQTTTYDKAFDIEKYRFVKNSGNWDVYRLVDGSLTEFKLVENVKFPLRVSSRAPIFVSKRLDHQLEVRRNDDDEHSAAIVISANRGKVTIDNAKAKTFVHYQLEKCAAGEPTVAETNTGGNKKDSGVAPSKNTR